MTITHTITAADQLADPSDTVDDEFAHQAVAGRWYAFGRMDQGHPAVVCLEAGKGGSPRPSAAATATHFGLLWARGCAREPGIERRGVAEAWKNYVASVGHIVTNRPEGW